jgi:two-component system, OmpR family, phosphate regulon sensor histidine kinase PhoR
MPRTRFVWHLFAGWCALAATVCGGCFWLASVELARLADQSQLRRMTDAATGLADTLKTGDGPVDTAAFTAAAREVARTARVGIELIGDGGTRLGGMPLPGDADNGTGGTGMSRWPDTGDALLQEARAGRIAHTSRYDLATGRRILAVALPLGQPGRPTAILRVLTDTTESDGELSQSQRGMLPGYLALLLAALAGGYGLANRATRPVKELSQAASRLAGGAFETPVPTPEIAELSDLATAVEVLREQLVERGLTIGRQGTQQEAVLGSMIEGVLAIDARQRIVSINRAAADLLGLDPDSAIRRPLQEAVRNPDLRRFALRAIDCREPVEDDLLLRGLRDRTIRVRGTALRDLSGEGGAVIVLNDVTDIQRLENVRRDFVANVSHELKTPIASIKGFVETLLDGAADDPADSRRFLDIVAKQADRLESIIEDLLSLSRIEQSEDAGDLPLERTRIATVLAEVSAECGPRASDRSIRLDVACDELLEADVNAPLLEQAAINLVDNAIKYSDAGKTVWISAVLEPAASGGRSALVISVRDEGCGIEGEHLPRLFERFYRVDPARSRKLGGTGLGLSIVKHIVQAHGGTIAVESRPGVGSTFTIRLPGP